MVTIIFVVLLSIALLALLFLAPTPGSVPLKCRELMATLPDDQLGSIVESLKLLVEALRLVHERDRLFYLKSGGIRGIIARLGLLRTYLQLVWILHHAKRMSTPDARSVCVLALGQLIFSLVALPESCLCLATGYLPHLASAASFACHEALVLRCEVAWASSRAPKCVKNLRELL